MKVFLFIVALALTSLSITSFTNNPIKDASLTCENLIENGDASANGNDWSIGGDGARISFNKFYLTKYEKSTDGFTQFVEIDLINRGKDATFSGWVKQQRANSLGKPVLRANFMNANGVTIKSTILKGSGEEWKLLSKRITIPEEATKVQIRLKATSYNSSLIVTGNISNYYDNIAFTMCDETLSRPE